MSIQTTPAFLAWYKWFPRDFSASEEAANLTLAEEGAVRRLLDHQCVQASIPADPFGHNPALAAKPIRAGCLSRLGV
jgi:hypothetical protein